MTIVGAASVAAILLVAHPLIARLSGAHTLADAEARADQALEWVNRLIHRNPAS